MDSQSLVLNEKDRNRLELLAMLIDTAANEFTKEIKLEDLSLKQSLLYMNFAAINNYSEGIYILCKDFRPFPAIVILRSIVEAFINTGYILTHNSDKRAVLFAMEDSYYRKGLVNEVLVFLSKHNQYEKDEFNRENLKNALIKIEGEIEYYKTRFNLNYQNKDDFKKDYHTNLLDRAKVADRRIKNPNFEHTYILVYRYFSEFGHLSMRGLDHFIIQNLEGNHEMIASQHHEVGHIIAMNYTIYLYFLSELKKRKMLSSDFPFKEFDKKWKEM